MGEDLLRWLPMPLSTRIELQTRPERDRFQTLIDQLREIADGAAPEPETAQRLDRPLVDLPSRLMPTILIRYLRWCRGVGAGRPAGRTDRPPSEPSQR